MFIPLVFMSAWAEAHPTAANPWTMRRVLTFRSQPGQSTLLRRVSRDCHERPISISAHCIIEPSEPTVKALSVQWDLNLNPPFKVRPSSVDT